MDCLYQYNVTIHGGNNMTTIPFVTFARSTLQFEHQLFPNTNYAVVIERISSTNILQTNPVNFSELILSYTCIPCL